MAGKNISNINNCYGCGVCTIACPKKIISLQLNNEGFYQPQIVDLSKCVNCGICLDVCAFNHTEPALVERKVSSYAGWSHDPRVRRKCSSGGVGFEIGRTLIRQGFKVCAVRYDTDNQRAEHYIASSIEELIQSIGSKYIQSYTYDAFRTINRKEKYLVTGTPCQIDSFRRYIQKLKIEDKFVLMDFFCHGVPSMLVWQKYLKGVQNTLGEISYVSWRNKLTGWHDSWVMAIEGQEKGVKIDWNDTYDNLIKEKKTSYYSRLTQGDLFYAFFLGNMCLGKACYNKCKYKYKSSSADIRIGDLWGKTYKKDDDGVSGVIAFTSRGNEVLQQTDCELIEHPFDVVAEGQIKTSIKMPYLRRYVISLLQSSCSLGNILKIYKVLSFPNYLLNIPIRVYKKIKRKLL